MDYPRINKSNQIGVQGEAYVESVLSSVAVCNKQTRDFGIDLFCNLIENGNVTGKVFFVQVKSTKKPFSNKFSVPVKKKSLKLWLNLHGPVYLFICFLSDEPKIYWANIGNAGKQPDRLYWYDLLGRDTPIRLDHSVEKLLNDPRDSINLPISNFEEFTKPFDLRLVEDIKTYYTHLDNSVAAAFELKNNNEQKFIPNEQAPKELDVIENSFRYCYSIAENTRAELIESYFRTWEKLENRYQYGYKLEHIRTALYSCHRKALTIALKALYYMESNAAYIMCDDLKYVCENVSCENRNFAFRESLQQFHCTPYVTNMSFTEILGKKLLIIACWYFKPDEVVPALADALITLRKKFPNDNNGILSPCPPNSIIAVSQTLEHLRVLTTMDPFILPAEFFNNIDPIVRLKAIEWFEHEVTDTPYWDWNYKVHVLSYHHLYEKRLPHSFNEMTDKAQKLIIEGLTQHPELLVRLDCLKVYGQEILRFSTEILDEIQKKRIDAEADALHYLDIVEKETREYLALQRPKPSVDSE